jgi:hypothetical protein
MPVIFHVLTLLFASTRLLLTEDRLKIRGFVRRSIQCWRIEGIAVNIFLAAATLCRAIAGS